MDVPGTFDMIPVDDVLPLVATSLDAARDIATCRAVCRQWVGVLDHQPVEWWSQHLRWPASVVLLACCERGQLPAAQWVKDKFKISVDDYEISILSNCSCGVDQPEVLVWLVDSFGLTAAYARLNDNEALRFFCQYNRLELAKALVSIFGLTVEDARCDENYPFRLACEYAHLGVAQWLTSQFGLTGADVRSRKNHALRFACQNGHLGVAEWLHSTFGLTAADAHADGDGALRRAKACGHREVVQWLIDTFGLVENTTAVSDDSGDDHEDGGDPFDPWLMW